MKKIIALVFMLLPFVAEGHFSSCHDFHSCEPDENSDSYTCGDLGDCTECTDNEFCENAFAKSDSGIILEEEPGTVLIPQQEFTTPKTTSPFNSEFESPKVSEVFEPVFKAPQTTESFEAEFGKSFDIPFGEPDTTLSEQNTAKLIEKNYQKPWCDQAGGKIKYLLKDQTRVDCLTDKHAIKFNFAEKWAAAIGESLYYSMMTGKTPGIVLIVKDKNSTPVKKLRKVAAKYDIKVWTVAR